MKTYKCTNGKTMNEKEAAAANKRQMDIFNEVFSAPAGKRDYARILDFEFFIPAELCD